MRNLLRSHCGHSSIRILCDTAEDDRHRTSVGLVRGAIFFLGSRRRLRSCTRRHWSGSHRFYATTAARHGRWWRAAGALCPGMASWSLQRVPNLVLSHAAVLPAFRAAARYHQDVLTGEILLSLGRLARKHSAELHAADWDVILDVLEELRSTLGAPTTEASPDAATLSGLYETILTIAHELVDQGAFEGSLDR